MKYIRPYIYIVSVLLISCSDSSRETSAAKLSKIQSVQALEIVTLVTADEGNFYYPRFTQDGSKVVFTTANHAGLYYYDLKTHEVLQLNSIPGAGVNFVNSVYDSKIFFTSDTLINRRRFHNLYVQSIETKKITKLNNDPLRYLSDLNEVSANTIVFYAENEFQPVSLRGGKSTPDSFSGYFFHIQNDKIFITRDGNQKIVTPFPNRNLIWLEDIPASTDVLVYAAGIGLYRYDPVKNTSKLLGDFRAAKCSPDGKLIAYIRDEDNGLRTTRSDIYVAILDDLKSFMITDSEDVHEMYPQWSPDGQKIVFHDEKGQIYMTKLQIK